MLHPAKDTHIEAGSTVVLTCVAYGVPPPLLTWSRNGSSLSFNDSRVTIYSNIITDSASGVIFARSIMKLCRSELADVGTYSCLTSNGIGDDSFTFEFSVESLEGKHSPGHVFMQFYLLGSLVEACSYSFWMYQELATLKATLFVIFEYKILFFISS